MLHVLVQFWPLNLCKDMTDHLSMNKHTARLMPVALVVTGLVAAFGGYFSGR